MTRETKVGLLVGLGMILLIGIIVSDHLSVVSQQEAATLTRFADDAQRALNGDAPTMPPAARQELTYQPPAQTQQPVPMAQELRQPQRETVTTDLTQEQPRRETYPQRAFALHEREQGHGSVQDIVTRDVTNTAVVQHHEQPRQAPGDDRLASLQQQGDFVSVRHELDRGSDTLRFRETPQQTTQQEQPQRLTEATRTIPVAQAQPTVIVKSGETLTAIAKDNLGSGSRWKEIFELNRDKLDTPESLQAGMQIKLPRNNTPVAQAPVAPVVQVQVVEQTPPAQRPQQPQRLQDLRTARRAETPERATQAQAQAPTGKMYVVQQGDNLYKIAQKTLGDGGQWKKLYLANKARIGDPDAVKVGMELMIPQS